MKKNKLSSITARGSKASHLAKKGRFGDSQMAHVEPGEIVVPHSAQTPDVMDTLQDSFNQAGIPMSRYTVAADSSTPGTAGDAESSEDTGGNQTASNNSENPETGAKEFFSLGSLLPIAGAVAGTVIGGPGLGTAIGSGLGSAAEGAIDGTPTAGGGSSGAPMSSSTGSSGSGNSTLSTGGVTAKLAPIPAATSANVTNTGLEPVPGGAMAAGAPTNPASQNSNRLNLVSPAASQSSTMPGGITTGNPANPGAAQMAAAMAPASLSDPLNAYNGDNGALSAASINPATDRQQFFDVGTKKRADSELPKLMRVMPMMKPKAANQNPTIIPPTRGAPPMIPSATSRNPGTGGQEFFDVGAPSPAYSTSGYRSSAPFNGTGGADATQTNYGVPSAPPTNPTPGGTLAPMPGAGSGPSANPETGQQQFYDTGDSHWIENATKHHGVFKAKAAHAGMSTRAFAEQEKHKGGVTGDQARLAITLMGMPHEGNSHNPSTGKKEYFDVSNFSPMKTPGITTGKPGTAGGIVNVKKITNTFSDGPAGIKPFKPAARVAPIPPRLSRGLLKSPKMNAASPLAKSYNPVTGKQEFADAGSTAPAASIPVGQPGNAQITPTLNQAQNQSLKQAAGYTGGFTDPTQFDTWAENNPAGYMSYYNAVQNVSPGFDGPATAAGANGIFSPNVNQYIGSKIGWNGNVGQGQMQEYLANNPDKVAQYNQLRDIYQPGYSYSATPLNTPSGFDSANYLLDNPGAAAEIAAGKYPDAALQYADEGQAQGLSWGAPTGTSAAAPATTSTGDSSSGSNTDSSLNTISPVRAPRFHGNNYVGTYSASF